MCQPAVGCPEDGPWPGDEPVDYEEGEYIELTKEEQQLAIFQAAEESANNTMALARSKSTANLHDNAPVVPISRAKRAVLAPLKTAAPIDYTEAPSFSEMQLALDHKSIDPRSGLIFVPIVFPLADLETGGTSLQQLQVRTTLDGMMRLPCGLSDPYNSNGGGPIRSSGPSSRPKAGAYSALLEFPEVEEGQKSPAQVWIERLELAALRLVCVNKHALQLGFATVNSLRDEMRSAISNNSSYAPAMNVKVRIGGKQAVRCTKNGSPSASHQGPMALLVADATVDPTLCVKGVWIKDKAWGTTVHMTQAEVIQG